MQNTSDQIIIIVTKTDGSGIFGPLIMALFSSVMFLVMLFVTISFMGSILIIIPFLIILGVFAFLFIDDVVWKAKGQEIISFDSKALYCTQKRLFSHNKEIPWDEIEDITLYEYPKIYQILSFFTLNGYNNYPTLRIRWLSGKKTKLGINLNDQKRRNLAKTIMQLRQIYAKTQKDG